MYIWTIQSAKSKQSHNTRVCFKSVNFSSVLAAWSSGIVSACGEMGREIESRQGLGFYIAVLGRNNNNNTKTATITTTTTTAAATTTSRVELLFLKFEKRRIRIVFDFWDEF
jgi:hypothetical protein